MDETGAQQHTRANGRTGAGLGVEAVGLGWGLALAAGVAWVVGGTVLLPRMVEDRPDAWLDLIYVVVALMFVWVNLALLGAFVALRGIVSARSQGRSRWSRWWALGLAAAGAAVTVVAAATEDPGTAALYGVPALMTVGLYWPVVASVPRLRMPRWLTAILTVVLVGVVGLLALPMLSVLVG